MGLGENHVATPLSRTGDFNDENGNNSPGPQCHGALLLDTVTATARGTP